MFINLFKTFKRVNKKLQINSFFFILSIKKVSILMLFFLFKKIYIH